MTETGQLPPLALLSGGLSVRLRPLTEKIPKAMLEVAGEPFVAHQLRHAAREGIDKVVLCVGYLADRIDPSSATARLSGSTSSIRANHLSSSARAAHYAMRCLCLATSFWCNTATLSRCFVRADHALLPPIGLPSADDGLSQ